MKQCGLSMLLKSKKKKRKEGLLREYGAGGLSERAGVRGAGRVEVFGNPVVWCGRARWSRVLVEGRLSRVVLRVIGEFVQRGARLHALPDQIREDSEADYGDDEDGVDNPDVAEAGVGFA